MAAKKCIFSLPYHIRKLIYRYIFSIRQSAHFQHPTFLPSHQAALLNLNLCDYWIALEITEFLFKNQYVSIRADRLYAGAPTALSLIFWHPASILPAEIAWKINTDWIRNLMVKLTFKQVQNGRALHLVRSIGPLRNLKRLTLSFQTHFLKVIDGHSKYTSNQITLYSKHVIQMRDILGELDLIPQMIGSKAPNFAVAPMLMLQSSELPFHVSLVSISNIIFWWRDRHDEVQARYWAEKVAAPGGGRKWVLTGKNEIKVGLTQSGIKARLEGNDVYVDELLADSKALAKLGDVGYRCDNHDPWNMSWD